MKLTKDDVEAIYKNEKQRSVELVFYNHGLRKSIGQRKPGYDLMKKLDEVPNQFSISEGPKEQK